MPDRAKEIDLLSADVPLTDPDTDSYGYAAFARHVATAISKMAPTEGFVISVHAPWGYGKTTALNFVRHYLNDLPEPERPTIVPFNPWWFSGSEDVARRFFEQLLREIDRSGRATKEFRKKLARFGEAVSEAPVPYAGLAKITRLISPGDESLYDLRTDLERHLRKLQTKILVIIDDVDRLTAEETRQVFRVVKAVVNLPNIVYLLAFDKERVASALDEFHPGSGPAYLEKIVQVPFDLPLPDRASLQKAFSERLNVVLRDVPDSDFDSVRWANIFFRGIDHFITSPRSIVRLINALTITFPAVHGEVDPIEFISIETLRVFSSSVYDTLRGQRQLFAGHANFPDDAARKKASAKAEEIVNLAPDGDREAVRNILDHLFPRISAAWGGMIHGSDWESIWRRDRRVASDDLFDVFFRLNVSPGALSNAEMRAGLDAMRSAEAFAELLLTLSRQKHSSGMNRARAFISRLEDYTDKDISLEYVRPAVTGLLRSSDELLRQDPDSAGPFDFGMEMQIGRVLYQLLRRLPEAERLDVLKHAAPSAALGTFVREARFLASQHDPDRESSGRQEPLLPKKDADEVRAIALSRIRESAATSELSRAWQLPQVLRNWALWGDSDEMRAWLLKRLDDPNFVEMFVPQLVQTGHVWGMSDVTARKTHKIDLTWVSRFVDPAVLADRVRHTLATRTSTKEQSEALRLFLDTVEGRVKDDE